MIQKKICMLGGFAVGKTSLVARYVTSMFSEKYLTTVGVKIDKKQVAVDGRDVTLMLWDIYGQDDFQDVQTSQLRGMSGYLLVVDGTRRATLETARETASRTEERCYLSEIHRLSAQLLSESPDAASRAGEIEQHLREAIRVAQEQGARAFQLRAEASLLRTEPG